MSDFRLAFRSLLRAPVFAAVAIVTLALGIGANAAVFSVVDGILLKPLAFPEPDRLMMVWEHNIPRDRRTNVVSPGNFIHWRERQTSFTHMAALIGTSVNFSEGDAPEELDAMLISPAAFPMLGMRPALGRAFTAEEDTPARDKGLISHALWQRRFGGDPGVLGRTITLSARPVQIVGVVPPDFALFDDDVDVWLPLGLPAQARTPRGRSLRVIAQLAPGVTRDQAQAEMTRISDQLIAEFPDFNKSWTTNVQPMSEYVAGDLRPTLLVLLAAVGFVVLVACANVAGLLLARASARQRELAVRTALGASRFRLARQALAESLTLAALGGAAGLGLAYFLVRLLLAAAQQGLNLPRAHEIGLDIRVIAFTGAVCVITGILFGLAPVLWARRAGVTDSLKEGGRGGTSGRAAGARGALVVAEIALAIVLLTGAGLMIRSFARLASVGPGFDTTRVMTFSVSLPGAQYAAEGRARRFFEDLNARLAAHPAVTAVGAVSFLPLTGPASATSYQAEGQPVFEAGAMPVTEVRVISGDYFAAMGIPLKAGRLYNSDEVREARRTIVISESMARQAFPGADPIGRRIAVSWADDEYDEVIGVVGDIHHAGLDEQPRPMIYWPHVRTPYTRMYPIVRTTGDPSAIVASAREEVRQLDAAQPIADVRTLETLVSRSIAQPRLIMRLLTVFAAVALTLAAIGIYGVVAYTVSQRTREIGIRVALGATPRGIARMIAGQGALLAALGIAIGVPAALVLARAMESMLFATDPADPGTIAAVALVLTAAAVAACLVPLRKALRVDPAQALRAD